MVNEGTRYRVRRSLELFLNTGARASVACLLASAVHNHAHIIAWAPRGAEYVLSLHLVPFLSFSHLLSSPAHPFRRPHLLCPRCAPTNGH
jgi:hypothetical protein